MERRLRSVLVVDDEENIRHMLAAVFKGQGLEVVTASTAAAALAELDQRSFDVLLSDIRMPGLSGLELLEQVRKRHGSTVVVLMSAYGGSEAAIEAIQRGAYDYIAKPFKPAEVVLLLRKAEERERLRYDNRRLRRELDVLESPPVRDMVAASPAMKGIMRTVRKIAGYKTTVLIQGESGTGKELVARALHRLSPRAEAEFVAVNCGAIPESLLESELFGHRKGAFTDAAQDHKGLFSEADGGTLFLDEVGELPLPLQVKLLRALQEEEIRPVGDTRTLKVDVRVVAATVRNLEAEVAAGRFREDLFYRLQVFPVTLPPLRERPEDVPLLVRHFIESTRRRLGIQVLGITSQALNALVAHEWPGNIRELENTIEHAMVLSDGGEIDVGALPGSVRYRRSPTRDGWITTLSIKKANRSMERELIERAMRQTRGNKTAAAKLLEISPRALLYKLKDYEIQDS